jgi:carbon-monoxide dehydrogenase large subunit
MPGSILGTSVRRVEDPSLLRGDGTFIDNMHVENVGHLVFVRSPFAHAKVLSITKDQAAAAPGVLGVFTAEDLKIPAHHAFFALNDAVKRPPLAEGEVRFVGDAVVAVVATSKAEALDAAELVEIDYEELPAIISMEDALNPEHPPHVPSADSNIAAGYRDPQGDSVLDDAEVVVRVRIENQRIAVVPMEGNAILVEPPKDGEEYRATVYVSTQMPHAVAGLLGGIFSVEPRSIRVVAPHVGGAFGGKAGVTAEHSVVYAAALLLNRPVKWVETRSENLIAMPHGRGQVQYVELGLLRDGTFTGLRCRMIGDAGAYGGFGGGLVLGSTRSMSQGVYRIPRISYDGVAVFTNTTPMGAFRGAGRPEAAAFLERVIDIAADELDIDPVEIRRKNLLVDETFPYTTVVGTVYDIGDYSKALNRLMELSDYEGLRKEQQERRNRGDRYQIGIGVSVYVEVTAGGGATEYSSVEVTPDGGATIKVGTSGHGQGHATSFSMIVSELLGIPLEKIRFIQSDTAAVPRGGGTGGSRSLQIGGSAVRGAAEAVLEKAKQMAASMLEAAEGDIVVTDSGDGLSVAGVPSSTVTWAQLASAEHENGNLLEATFDFSQAAATFPFGAHLSTVLIDLETGKVTPTQHIAVDDCGRVLNPMIVQGQQHGGIAQGVAQALWEQYVYDDDGNPLTSTLAEYAMPSAAELPSFEAVNVETPTPLNALGAKGIGESGTIGSMPAVHNAVVDALSYLGVRHIDMPCTPQRVWEALNKARNGESTIPWNDPPKAFETLPVRGQARESDAASVDV